MGTGRFKKRMSFVEFNHKHPDRLALAELGASSGSVETGSLAFTDLHPELLSSDTLSRTPKTDPKKTQYGLNSILPDICRPIVAKYDLNYSRRSLTQYSGSVPAFFRIMTSQFGGSGEKWYNWHRYGLCCTRITSGIPMTCQGLP